MHIDPADWTLADLFPDNPWRVNYRINWSVKHRLIYVETPKVGCTLIKRMLQYSELDYDAARLPEDVHERDLSPLRSPEYDQDEFRRCMSSPDYLKFTFVRNPFTRTLSAYLDKIHGRPGITTPIQKRFGIDPSVGIPSFAEFLQRLSEQAPADMDPHWAPQTYLLNLPTIRYDFIGRFEAFDASLARLLALRPLEIPPRATAGSRQHATHADDRINEYYTPALVGQVRNIFADDFTYLGYGWSL